MRETLKELEGFAELGMANEAMALARRILKSPGLSSVGFRLTVTTILAMSSALEKWRVDVAEAYGRLTAADKKDVASAMLGYYCSLGDWKLAAKFVPAGPKTFNDAFLSMGVLLGLGRFTEAKRIIPACEELLGKEKGDYERNALHDALADYYSQTGNWTQAVEHWSQVSLAEPLGTNALIGIVQAQVVGAIETVRRQLTTLEEYSKSHVGQQEVQLPGNEASILEDTRKRLRKMAKQLQSVLPKWSGAKA